MLCQIPKVGHNVAKVITENTKLIKTIGKTASEGISETSKKMKMINTIGIKNNK